MSDVTLYEGDCLDYSLRHKPFNFSTCMITDPPYGIGINKSNRLSESRGFGDDDWDNERQPETIRYLHDKFEKVVVWGGNYYTDVLPYSRGWLAWDKLNDGRDFGELELAWTNVDMVIRRYKKFPVKMDGGKVHPTQKPIELMKCCIELLSEVGDTIFDPFMGSGTTGVAAVQLGRKFIGCEKKREYYQIAEKRIAVAKLQPALFQVDKSSEKQSELF
jgi:DNA modification methylase